MQAQVTIHMDSSLLYFGPQVQLKVQVQEDDSYGNLFLAFCASGTGNGTCTDTDEVTGTCLGTRAG